MLMLFSHCRMISCCVTTTKARAKINWVIHVHQLYGIERKSSVFSLVSDYCYWLRHHYYCWPHRVSFAANAAYAAAARNSRMPTPILTRAIDEKSCENSHTHTQYLTRSNRNDELNEWQNVLEIRFLSSIFIALRKTATKTDRFYLR